MMTHTVQNNLGFLGMQELSFNLLESQINAFEKLSPEGEMEFIYIKKMQEMFKQIKKLITTDGTDPLRIMRMIAEFE